MATPKREKHVNLASSLLNGAINNSVTSLDVDTGSLFPSDGNFRVMVDDEIMICTARSTNTLTVVRGQDGTSAASHADDAPIAMVMTKQSLFRLHQDHDALWGYASRPPLHGVYNDAGTGKLVATDFTWVNQGGASRNDNGDSITLRCPTDATKELRMQALTPGGNFTYVGSFRGVAGGDGSCFMYLGMGLREDATGKVITIGYGGTSTTRHRAAVGKWTASGTLSGGSFTFDRTVTIPNSRIWFKVVYDGTDVKFYMGVDGISWALLLSESKTTFFTTAPDQVVWFGNNFENSGTGAPTATELVVSLDHWHKE